MVIGTSGQVLRASLLGLAALAAGGCATGPEGPLTEIVRAETAIEQAEGEAVARYASPALNKARRKLNDAKLAQADDELQEARWLADEALVDARYAVALAEATEARTSLEDARAGVELLRQEIQRGN